MFTIIMAASVLTFISPDSIHWDEVRVPYSIRHEGKEVLRVTYSRGMYHITSKIRPEIGMGCPIATRSVVRLILNEYKLALKLDMDRYRCLYLYP